jgi:hypothetical protein
MPKHTPMPPLERLNELLKVVPVAPHQFNTQSGLVWRVKRGRQGAGSNAGSLHSHVYQLDRLDWRVRVDGKTYAAARVIYYMVNGFDPGKAEVDHKDQNSLNNNESNLRLGDDCLQAHNRGKYSTNSSGAIGVCLYKAAKKWQAELMHKGVLHYLGRYTCKIEAARAYNDKVIELGLDKNYGKPLNELENIVCGCGRCV